LLQGGEAEKPHARAREQSGMVSQGLPCPHGHSTAMVRHGTTRQGQQRERCRTCPQHGRPFRREDASGGQSPEFKRQMVARAQKASGMRETARGLPVSPTPGMQALKKSRLPRI
jgi:transposase-like protein